MKVLWTHNYDPHDESAGSFMFTAAEAMRAADVQLELLYLGNLRRPLGIFQGSVLARKAAMRFDLVHAQFGSATALATGTITGRPLVLSIRGSDWTPALSDSVGYRLHAKSATAMTKASLGRYSLAVCVSQRLRSEVAKYAPTLPAIALPDPIDLEKFRPRDKREVRRMLGLKPDGVKYVLFTAGDLSSPHKRFWLAERAVNFANEQLGNVELLVGTGYHPDQMPTLVAAADVAISTSSAEGWPNCIKESLACDVPFVATDVSDLATIAAIDGSCRVVDANAVALGNALCDALESQPPHNLRSHLGPMTMKNFSEGLVTAYEGVLRARNQ